MTFFGQVEFKVNFQANRFASYVFNLDKQRDFSFMLIEEYFNCWFTQEYCSWWLKANYKLVYKIYIYKSKPQLLTQWTLVSDEQPNIEIFNFRICLWIKEKCTMVVEPISKCKGFFGRIKISINFITLKCFNRFPWLPFSISNKIRGDTKNASSA